MSGIREALAEGLAVLTSKIGTASSTPLISGAIPMAQFDQIAVIIQLGDMASETIDSKVETVDSDGTSNAATLKSATQLAASASANDNKILVFNVRQEELIASGKKHIRASITTGGATGGSCCITAVAIGAKYGPATDNDSANVVQVKL